MNETKSLLFEKINKIDKPLDRLFKQKRERSEINTIKNEKVEVTNDFKGIQRNIKDYCEPIKWQSGRKGQVLLPLSYSLTKLNQEETENMNSTITRTKFETVILELPKNKS